MKILGPCIVLLILSYPITSAATQDSDSADTDQANDDDRYEVVISGRVTRAKLRNLIEDVEEDFFARFNELNTDDLYDVYCYRYTPTTSHISERVCEPVFQISARADNLSDVVMGMACSGSVCNSDGSLLSAEALRAEVQPDYETLQGKLEEFTRTDARFRQIGNVLAELRYRLEIFGED